MSTAPAAVSEPLTLVRPQLPDAPTTLVLSEHPVFKRFLYAVCFSRDVGDEPLARRLLGTDLVVWRSAPDAPVSVALDRCAHRDAPLSRGWLKGCHLVCPYHGWEWDRHGATQRIPQFPDARRPSKSGLTMVTSEERYDMVWVCLDEAPLVGVPPLPVPLRLHGDAPAGEQLRPRPRRLRPPQHLRQPGQRGADRHGGDASSPWAGDAGQGPGRGPPGRGGRHPADHDRHGLRAVLRQHPDHLPRRPAAPDGQGHQPVDDQSCNLLQTVLRTDTEGDLAGRQIHDFDIRVEDEDRALLELLPTPFPLAVHLNAHARADRSSLALRRMWSELVTGSWTPTW